MKILTMHQYIKTLPELTLYAMVLDYKKFKEQGCIGDCTLREHSEAYVKQLGIPSSITDCMQRMIFEVYEVLALKYIEDNYESL